MSDFGTGKQYWLRNLKSLIITTGFAQEQFTGMPCPPGVPKSLRKGPEGPVSHARANIFLADMDPQTGKPNRIIVFGTNLWDSRPGWAFSRKEFIDCEFPSGNKKWVVFTLPITAYDYRVTDRSGAISSSRLNNETYKEPRQFEWDVLPVVLDRLKACLGSNADLSNLKLISAYFGNETFNSTIVVSTWINPRLKLVLKDSGM